MFVLKWWRRIRRRKPGGRNAPAADLEPSLQRDIGIKVTRIRLPSGRERVIVEKSRDE